jgi:dTDP-4-dehydrorhamnose reductase
MRILVTGANGQVGFSLAKLLKEKAYDFLALDRCQLDITNLSAVEKVIGKFQPQIVINAAAYTAVDKAESDIDQAYSINAKGSENLALAARSVDAAIFHISTDYVFSGDSAEPYRENDIVGSQSVYGLSKLKAEELVSSANSLHIILRTSWVFCEHGNNFVKTMIRLGRDREQLGIVCDQVGGPTYAGDIAYALLGIARHYEKNKTIPWGTYHFSGFPYVSWFDFAKEIFNEVAEQNIYTHKIPLLKQIKTHDYPTPARRPKNSCLNCEKIYDNFSIGMSDWKKALKNIKGYI